ncbi:hypothetical protein Poli38472_012827 [Pythium oligandrum]|uniref:Transcription initiation factor TFIID subunit 12 domain-containing protein n=1 Tax=Pythium oligandrum TaxID=41045 RepID=A0A8K1CK93_PYTOL|nr:hypothetical protein Poli38472_012827 [Pythium oligandrum]|eukprot:TMW64205.1 hypothetical protein Poli38472_012827 [Pythium oligandrum]
MPADKKQRLVPGSMYIPPTPTPMVVGGGLSSVGAISKIASPKLSASASPSGVGSATVNRALTPNKQLGEILRSVEPRFCFHAAVEELLLDMASDFVTDVVSFSSRLAKHRRTTVLEAKDMQFYLAKNYGISLAGAVPSTNVVPSGVPAPGDNSAVVAGINPLTADILVRSRPAKNSLHMHRVALKRKTLQRAKLKKSAVKITDAPSAKKAIPRKGSIAKSK